MTKDYDKDGREALEARVQQLEAEIVKLINMIEGQNKDIDALKARLVTIKTLAMGEIGKRKVSG